MQDLVPIVYVFSARLYCSRSYKKVIRDAALQKDQTEVSEQDAATLEMMQGKCRGLYNWWVLRLRAGERWRCLDAKKTLAESRKYDPENSAVNHYQRFFARLGLHTGDPVRCAAVFTAIDTFQHV